MILFKTMFTVFVFFDMIAPTMLNNLGFMRPGVEFEPEPSELINFKNIGEGKMSTTIHESEQKTAGLTENVIQAVRHYLTSDRRKDVNLNLHQLILELIEVPLFRTVMEMTRYNQSKAARVLGVSRGTLRTKLKRYFDDEFIGSRDYE